MWGRLSRLLEATFLVASSALLLTYSAPQAHDVLDQARAFTRNVEFDYLSWMLDAARVKVQAGAAGIPGYLDRELSRIAVSDYLQIADQIMQSDDALNRIYASPDVVDKIKASALIRGRLQQLQDRERQLAPLAEGILQAQVAAVAADAGFAILGQPIPSVLYHATSVPDALIISPRGQIRQAANISVQASLPVDQQAALEQHVESGLDVSALVVPVGGIGVYPTMIMRTTDRTWLLETIAHEWTHNYLELRPLGLLYDRSPELRTMNETTADLVGTEIGAEVNRRYYSAAGIALSPDLGLASLQLRYPDPGDADSPPFDFRSEMHTTRVTVDDLLAAGKITEAEGYMERRRRTFIENGYFLRRLNQAYFAFYGAYADVPGGAAGEDPVGPAVRALRSRSASLADFVNRISWMTSFEQLRRAVGQ